MKKIIFILLAGLMTVSVSGFVGTMIVSGAPEGDEPISEAYYVFTENIFVKNFLNIRHDFKKAFSADLSKGQLKAIEILGIRTEPVGIFTISDIVSNPCRNDKNCDPEYYCDKTNSNKGMGVCLPIEGGTEPEPEPEPEPEYPTRNCSPQVQKPWGIGRVNGSSGGEGIKIAVLDTGVMQSHLDLENSLVGCETTVTRFTLDTRDCEDGHGHGTHVAGTILADSGKDGKGIYGVAPGAELIAIKVCDRQGRCYGDDIAAGIRKASELGAKIISMSLGGSTLSSVEQSAIDNAINKGILVVAAAGNSGPNLGTIGYPAGYYKVVSVAAIDSNDRVADFSSRGDGRDWSNDLELNEKLMEVSGPGVSVYSTWNDGCFRTLSGTSMATPHVSGLAAKLWAGTAETTRELLRNYAQDIISGHHTKEEYDPASGFGVTVFKEE